MIFRLPYFMSAVVLLLVELFIALKLNDPIIRPYVGDSLAVILIYCFLRSFFRLSCSMAILISLLFAYFIEFMQYLDILSMFGWKHSHLANMFLGNRFEWIDMIAYSLGALFVFLIEHWMDARFRNSRKAAG